MLSFSVVIFIDELQLGNIVSIHDTAHETASFIMASTDNIDPIRSYMFLTRTILPITFKSLTK